MSATLNPVRWLNYRADVRSMVGEVVGPNLLGEYLTAVTADFDDATGYTRVGFVFGRVEVAS